jgi:hypothetical protein
MPGLNFLNPPHLHIMLLPSTVRPPLNLRPNSVYFVETPRLGIRKVLCRKVTQGKVLFSEFSGPTLNKWTDIDDFRALNPLYVGRYRPVLSFFRRNFLNDSDPATFIPRP